jgi:hypothetical protein
MKVESEEGTNAAGAVTRTTTRPLAFPYVIQNKVGHVYHCDYPEDQFNII